MMLELSFIARRTRVLRGTRGSRPAHILTAAAMGLAVLTVGETASATDYTIAVDAGKEVSKNPHFWSAAFGTGKAKLALRGDWQTHYKIGNRELGAQRVRGHGLLNDEMGLYQGAGSYDWTNLDTYLAAISTANMRPIIELDFMPTALASNGDKSPPKDYNEWKNFVTKLTQHCIEKFDADDVAKWYFEVWNEPDYSGFWTGTDMNAYYTLYDNTATALTSVIPNVLVGGPATTGNGPVAAFLKHTKSSGARVAFVSNHDYPGGSNTGTSCDPNSLVTDNAARLSAITGAGYTTADVKSFNTEWNSSYSGQGGNTGNVVLSMDNHWNVGFILKAAKLLADKTTGDTPAIDVFSYWTLTDVFDEDGGTDGIHMTTKGSGNTPFDTVFGTMTFQGMRKAAFNAFKLLNYMGPKRMSASGGTNTADGVDAFVAESDSGDELQIVLYNYAKAISTASGSGDNVTVNVSSLPAALAGKEVFVTQFIVDETHSNPYSVWEGQSKPASPTEAQWEEMRKAQHLALAQPVSKKTVDTTFTTTFAMKKQSGSLIILGTKRPLTGRNSLVEIEGEDFDGQSGATKEDSGDATTLGQSISVTSGGYVYFENVDYTDDGVDSVQLRVKTAADTSLELHSETQTGTLLGKCAVTSTSNAWATQTCKLAQAATGVSKLYVVFGGAAHLNWLKFQSGNSPSPGTGGAGGGGGTPDGGSKVGAGGTSAAGGSNAGRAGASGGRGGSAGGAVAGASNNNGGAGQTTSGGAGQATSGGAGQGTSGVGRANGAGGGNGNNGGNSSADAGAAGSNQGDGQSNAGASGSSKPASGKSGCGCRLGGTGGPKGTFAVLGLLLGVVALRRRSLRADWERVSRVGLALLAAACSSTKGGTGPGGEGGSDCENGACGGQAGTGTSGGNGSSVSDARGGSAGIATGRGGAAGANETAGADATGASGTAGSSGKASKTGSGGAGASAGTGGGGAGTSAGPGSGGAAGTAGKGGAAGKTGSGGAASAQGDSGVGVGGTKGTGGTSANPITLPNLVTSGPSAYWKTDGELKEVTDGSADVTVNDGSPAQNWEGFGAAFNEMGWNYLSMLSDDDKTKALNLLFSADGANFAWGRIPMGASDYATDRYTLDETPDDPSMSQFSIDRDKQKLLPFVKAAQAIKNDMRFWASPWTPPTWMKDGPFNDNFAYDGGKIKTDDTTLQALADYFVKFVQAYAGEGVPIEIVSPQNEPGYSGTYPTCGWDPTAYATFVGKHLGPTLTSAGLTTKIMLGTFNGGTGDTTIVSTVMGDSTAKGYIKVFGYQWGMDSSVAGAKQYNIPVWQTEHKCGNYPWGTYDKNKAPNDQAYAVESWGLIRDWIKNGVTAYSTWNVVLDTVGNGIDSARVWPQNALLTVDTSAKKLNVTPAYYVFRHFSQFVTPGAKVVGTSGGDAVAFKNPDSSIVAVAYNSGSEKTMTVAIGGKKLQFEMPATGWATVYSH